MDPMESCHCCLKGMPMYPGFNPFFPSMHGGYPMYPINLLMNYGMMCNAYASMMGHYSPKGPDSCHAFSDPSRRASGKRGGKE